MLSMLAEEDRPGELSAQWLTENGGALRIDVQRCALICNGTAFNLVRIVRHP